MLLQVENLCVEYHKVPAIRELSFHVDKGEIVCFVGPNGAGKSTTALTIAGILTPSSGSVRFDGRTITGMPAEDIARLGISLVPESRRIFGRMTVMDNLRVGAALLPKKTQVNRSVERVFGLFPDLKAFAGRPAGTLSGGQQQQLAVARAMVTAPRLMIVDEPSLGLAPQFVDLIFSTFATLRAEGVTLLVIEQSSRRALALANRVYLIRSGRLLLQGDAATLREDPSFEAEYFGGAGVP